MGAAGAPRLHAWIAGAQSAMLEPDIRPSVSARFPMQVACECPVCEAPVRANVGDSTELIDCPRCGWSRSIASDDVRGGSPVRCLVCSCGDLWRQKDIGVSADSFVAEVPRHGVAMVRLSAAK